MIAEGKKSIETRGYPLPPHYLGKTLAIIETYGSKNKKQKATIVGLVRFSECYKYPNLASWEADFIRHQIKGDNPEYAFSSTKEKWAWVIDFACKIHPNAPAPAKKGIKFSSKCSIPSNCLSSDLARIARFVESQ